LALRRRQPVMARGTVKWFDPNRGYGFIRPERVRMCSSTSARCRPAGCRPCRKARPWSSTRAGTKGTAGRQPTTTAGMRVGLTRAPACHRVNGLHRCGLRFCLLADATRAGRRALAPSPRKCVGSARAGKEAIGSVLMSHRPDGGRPVVRRFPPRRATVGIALVRPAVAWAPGGRAAASPCARLCRCQAVVVDVAWRYH
jgi:'Cold-shock' DNA-binding domain